MADCKRLHLSAMTWLLVALVSVVDKTLPAAAAREFIDRCSHSVDVLQSVLAIVETRRVAQLHESVVSGNSASFMAGIGKQIGQ